MQNDEGERAKISYTLVPNGSPVLNNGRYYVGIDPSLTGFGTVVLLPTGRVEAWQYASRHKEVLRLVYFELWFHHLIDYYERQGFSLGGVGMEGYSYGSQNTHAHALGEIGGITKLVLAKRFGATHPALQSLSIPPSTLKKFVTGKGNAPKDMMRLEVFKRWGLSFSTTDMTDAYALARAAQVIYGAVPDKYGELLPQCAFERASSHPPVRCIRRRPRA